MNKHGTSLVELIISIALISVVMIFMFKLIADLNNDITNNDFAKDNQIIRAQIIRFIENDIIKHGVINEDDIVINGDTVSYTNRETVPTTRKWTMKNCTLGDMNYSLVNGIMIVNIPVYTNNDKNSEKHNNPIDDITLTYIN